MISPQTILAALEQLMPLALEATALLAELDGGEPISAAELIELSPRIEAACAQAERVAESSQKVVLRCLALKAMPSPAVPLGF